MGIGVEIVTFAVRSSRPSGMGVFADQGVLGSWREWVVRGHKDIVSAVENREEGISVTGTGIVTGER